MLAKAPGSRINRVPTPLTNENRLRGREDLRRRPRKQTKPVAPKPARRCRSCGEELPHTERVYCEDCLPTSESSSSSSSRVRGFGDWTSSRPTVATTHGGKAATRRGQSIAERKSAIREWERQFGKVVDLSLFEREILPLIRDVPLSRLVRRQGCRFTTARRSGAGRRCRTRSIGRLAAALHADLRATARGQPKPVFSLVFRGMACGCKVSGSSPDLVRGRHG
jgi:hypothetical protein